MGEKVEGTDSSTEERRATPAKSEDCIDESAHRPNATEEADWTEEQAFASVHDLVHYAILSQPGRSASLRQIYTTCEQRGRIAYKHGKGSRLITANEHWKSQIRHALYTSPRFSRIQGGDDWSVSNGGGEMPKTTLVRVPTTATSTTAAVKEVKEVEQRPRRKASLGVAVAVRGEEAILGASGSPRGSPKRAGAGHSVRKEGSPDARRKRSRLGAGSTSSPQASEVLEMGGTGTPMPGGSTQTRWPLSEVAGLAAAAMLEASLDGSGSVYALKQRDMTHLDNIQKGASGGSTGASPPDSSSPSRCGSPTPSTSIVVTVGCRTIVPKARDPSRNRRKPAQGLQAAMPSGNSSPHPSSGSIFHLERRNSQNLADNACTTTMRGVEGEGTTGRGGGGPVLERQSSLSRENQAGLAPPAAALAQ